MVGFHQSLSLRLSIWLALQGLIAALVVTGTVYVATSFILESRQNGELQLKSEAVRHALAEAAQAGGAELLQHKLADFLAGHQDLSLRISFSSGDVLYQASSEHVHEPLRYRVRELTWQTRWPPGTNDLVNVSLAIDITRDSLLLRRLGWVLLGVSLAGAVVVSLTGYLLVKRGMHPVLDLAKQVDAVTLGRPGMRLDGNAQPQELLPLVERFNALLNRVERSYAQLEGFNADVAHELRTPLATLIGSSEVALQRIRSIDELQEVIAGNLEDLRRLAGIVNDMLFLSQADRGAEARRTLVVSLRKLVEEVGEYHEAALLERDLVLQCLGDGSGEFDAPLLKRAVSNLLSNATRYAKAGTSIMVRVHVSDDRVRIAVENRGGRHSRGACSSHL